MNTDLFWDIRRPRSYGCMLNFIIGARGAGKTYGFKYWAIDDFLKTGQKFVYVRRFKSEIENKDLSRFFDDILVNNEFPGHELTVKGKTFLIDGKTAGTAIALSTAKIKKSVSFPDYNKICFDEFIIDKSAYHYLPDEVTNFLELVSTVARLRDNVTVWLLSNAITINNPYFDYFGLTVPFGKDIARKGPEILIQLTHNERFEEAASKTRFGQLVAGTPYGDYAIENQFLRDNKNFVEQKTAAAKYYFTIRFHGKEYGIYADFETGILYVSNDADKTFQVRFALTDDDHIPNTLIVKGRRNPYIANMINCYAAGALRFESVKIKGAMLKAIALLR